MIYEYQKRLPKEWGKYICDKPLRHFGSICEAKRHHPICKTTPWCDEHSLQLVLYNNPNLKVAKVAITQCVVALISCYLVYHLILE